jgi:hypothetical protein
MVLTHLPGKAFLIAGVLALSGIVVGVLGAREPVSEAVSAPVMAQTEFGSRFDLSADDHPLMKKSDRLAVRAVTEPVPVQTERVVPPSPATMPAVVVVKDEDDKPVSSRRKHRGSDLCGRHNMRKVWVSSKRWRCRK